MFPVLYEGKTDEDIPRFKSGNKEYEMILTIYIFMIGGN